MSTEKLTSPQEISIAESREVRRAAMTITNEQLADFIATEEAVEQAMQADAIEELDELVRVSGDNAAAHFADVCRELLSRRLAESAATDMLEALQNLVASPVDAQLGAILLPTNSDKINAARAAIAKATGQEDCNALH